MCTTFKQTGYALLTNIVWDYPFLSRLYRFFNLSIKDLEIQDEFNLFQSLHLCIQKAVSATRPDHLEESAESLLYNFHRKHILLKIKIKKL